MRQNVCLGFGLVEMSQVDIVMRSSYFTPPPTSHLYKVPHYVITFTLRNTFSGKSTIKRTLRTSEAAILLAR